MGFLESLTENNIIVGFAGAIIITLSHAITHFTIATNPQAMIDAGVTEAGIAVSVTSFLVIFLFLEFMR